MKGKLIYLFLWLVTVYLGILYYSRALLGLAALEFFLPVISFLFENCGEKDADPSLPFYRSGRKKSAGTGGY